MPVYSGTTLLSGKIVTPPVTNNAKDYYMTLEAPVAELLELVENMYYITPYPNYQVLDELGFILIPNLIPKFDLQNLTKLSLDVELQDVPFHSTRVLVNSSRLMKYLVEMNAMRQLVQKLNLFSGNVGISRPCLFRKKANDDKRIHLHNDLNYMMGGYSMISVFIALTPANKENGGLVIFPGTHHFGSLGDAGEINRNILPPRYPSVQTSMNPGDIMLMNSATWHESNGNSTDSDRVYIEFKLQPADDPTTKHLLCGERKAKYFIDPDCSEVFTDSRVKKLQRFYSNRQL